MLSRKKGLNMNKLIFALFFIPVLSFAESGLKIHGINTGYGYGDPVVATGFGLAYKNVFLDRFILPDSSAIKTLSYSSRINIGLVTFGSYTGVSTNDSSGSFLASYQLGEANLYFQPFVRVGHDVYIEAAAMNSGIKVSFLITAR
jgi:hypothetical protein